MENKAIEQLVHEVIEKVAREKKLELDEVHPGQRLVSDIGFKSIDLARIIAILEIRLNVDPFSKLVPITSIQTAADLVKAYQLCFSPNPVPAFDPQLDHSQSRAEARLRSSGPNRGELRKRAKSE
jgi:acyl carrier protein